MYKGIRRYLRTVACGLAILFASYYATTALFAHVHVVNGVILVHSQPFTKSHLPARRWLFTFFPVFIPWKPDRRISNFRICMCFARWLKDWKSRLSCLLMRQEFISVLLPYDSSIGDLKNLV